jgi:hypothetical protein
MDQNEVKGSFKRAVDYAIDFFKVLLSEAKSLTQNTRKVLASDLILKSKILGIIEVLQKATIQFKVSVLAIVVIFSGFLFSPSQLTYQKYLQNITQELLEWDKKTMLKAGMLLGAEPTKTFNAWMALNKGKVSLGDVKSCLKHPNKQYISEAKFNELLKFGFPDKFQTEAYKSSGGKIDREAFVIYSLIESVNCIIKSK